MNPNLSPVQFRRSAQLVKVHRGLSDVEAGQDVFQGRQGMHWSTNLGVARKFAEGKEGYASTPEGKPGVILHGYVGKRHTLQHSDLDANEREAVEQGYSILEPSAEREVTVEPGKPVLLTGLTSVKPRGPRGGYRTRTRTFNPPRRRSA